MRPQIALLSIAPLICTLSGLAQPAKAAVRVCQPAVVVGPFEAPTEIEAKRKALEAWVREAARHGRQFTGWSVAVNKELKCLPGEGGKSRCAARGEPCRIQQAPPRRLGPRDKPIAT